MTVPFLTGGLTLPHGFFTRLGGVSAGQFASLNCSLFGRDDPEAVRENRARAAGGRARASAGRAARPDPGAWALSLIHI